MRRSKEVVGVGCDMAMVVVKDGDGDGVGVSQVEWNLIRLDSHHCQQGRY